MGHTLLQVLQRISQLAEKAHTGYQVSPQAIQMGRVLKNTDTMGGFSRLD